MNNTDWTKYYHKKKSIISAMTQKITLRQLRKTIEKMPQQNLRNIMEIGGGNSCFMDSICLLFNIKEYSVIDNNELGLQLLSQKKFCAETYLVDILEQKDLEKINKKYDLVYSIGVIEHFTGQNIKKAIKAHFELCRRGGGL